MATAPASLNVKIADLPVVLEAMQEARRQIDSARNIAVALEQECAAKDARIAEADRWLDMAATYATSEDVAAAIDDARAALRGGAE